MVVHKQLRLSLAYCLCQPLLDLHIGGSPASFQFQDQTGHQHTFTFERKHFASGAKKGEKRGICKVCGSKRISEGKRKDTKTANKCLYCDLFLCEGVCFADYHTKAKV